MMEEIELKDHLVTVVYTYNDNKAATFEFRNETDICDFWAEALVTYPGKALYLDIQTEYDKGHLESFRLIQSASGDCYSKLPKKIQTAIEKAVFKELL